VLLHETTSIKTSKTLVNSFQLFCRILLVFAFSVKRVKDPCQQFSTVLLETATTWNNLNKGIEGA